MEIPKYYEIDTENFEITFDNTKKVHVAKNRKTGEETNINVLGILMQMGILKPGSEKDSTRVKVDQVLKRLESIESRVGIAPQKIQAKPEVKEKPQRLIKEVDEMHEAEDEQEDSEEPEEEPPKRKPPSKKQDSGKDILDEIEEETDRVLSKEERPDKSFMKSTGKDIKKEIMESVLEKTMSEDKKEKEKPNIKKESEEEIDNWFEI
jgi:hypothetical protein